MAVITFSLSMCPFEFKPGGVMIKFRIFPILKSVASGTVRLPIYLKLTDMWILVATGAFSRKPCKLLYSNPSFIFLVMAFNALQFSMCSFQFKFSL